MLSVAWKLKEINEQHQEQSLVSMGRLQEDGAQHQKSVLASSFGANVFFSSESRHDRTGPRREMFVSTERL
jgi:hypothetical protein